MQFLWGAATSAHQVEGYNKFSDWWHWEEQGNIDGGAKSGPATDHWHRYREDIALMKNLGLNSYRFSIEWAKLEPKEGEWNEEALLWYENLLSECERNDLCPMLTLHHFTLPKWLADRGGLCAESFVSDFSSFVKKVVDRFGKRVPLWCTFNEPMVVILGSYFGKFMPPGEQDPKKVALACRQVLQAHVQTYDYIHREVNERSGPWKNEPIMVGFAHNMFHFFPDRAWNPIEIFLAKLFERFYNLSWLHAVIGKRQHFGLLGLIPYGDQLEEARGRCSVDFIGVNYYTKLYVQWWPRNSKEDNVPGVPIGVSFARREEEKSDMNWAIHPRGLSHVLRLASRCKVPLYVTENGIADKDDSRRSGFILRHLEELMCAHQSGLNIRGYYYWSLLDNFEWSKGFGPRFGLAYVNYENFERSLRPSAFVFKEKVQELRNLIES